MNIGQAATATGLTTKTIRYYEHQGLLPPAPRTESGYRQYRSADIERLEFIKKAKRLGLTLDEIRDILAIHDEHHTPCVHVLALLDQKLRHMTEVIRDLQSFRRELIRLRDDSKSRIDQIPAGARICGIIEKGIHARGETALAWLELRRRR